MSSREIWGFTVRLSPAGKKLWPNELKREAVRRLREDGVSPGDVAAELGAHECLVRKWSVADRRVRGEVIQSHGQTFAEINISERQFHTAPGAMGRMQIGSISFEFPIEIAEADLLKLVRVAGQVT